MKSSRIIRILLVTTLILSVTLVANMFIDDASWNLFDYVVMGGLLVCAGLAYELIASRVNKKHRSKAVFILIALLVLIWAELAVGLFGTPFAGS
jgi:hypothetical protein